jgi:23S rRNA (guanosine2251-2'-O)-methyltransferase
VNLLIVVIAHNIRSAHNIGALFRTCDGLGISKLYLTGYTPYPNHEEDERLPHLARKIDKQIAKTALGAEKVLKWEKNYDVFEVINKLKKQGYAIAALEQADSSIPLSAFKPAKKTALLLGNEIGGTESEVLKTVDVIVEIPMYGQKESFNVVIAAAIALYAISTADT